jgi:hypothetical protein
MKKFVCMMMVIAMTAMMSLTAHGEGMSADVKAFSEMKCFRTEGTLSGVWTIGFQRDSDGRYPCALDIGDGRVIMVPLTDDEVNTLMVKALEEHKAEVEEAEKAANPNMSIPARVIDWITFWD